MVDILIKNNYIINKKKVRKKNYFFFALFISSPNKIIKISTFLNFNNLYTYSIYILYSIFI